MRIKGFTFFFIPATLIAIGLSVVGCSTATGSDSGPGAETSPSVTAGAPTSTAHASGSEPWDACPAIVTSFNSNANDPSEYSQLDATGFAVQEVGSDVLGGACVIAVATKAETFTWAILRGDAALAASIKADLITAGYEEGGLFLGNPATGQGILVASVANGAALDKYLVYPTAFAPYDEPLIYIGTFKLG